MGWLDYLLYGVVLFIGFVGGLSAAAALLMMRIELEPRGADEWNAQEGILAFIQFLSTQPDGELHLPTLDMLLNLLRGFCATHELPPPRPGWETFIKQPEVETIPGRYTPSIHQSILE